MRAYFKSTEFWQCLVFLIWSLFELTIVCLRITSRGVAGAAIGSFSLITGVLFLIKSFIKVVREGFEVADGGKSAVARVFIYSTGTLAMVLSVAWYFLLSPSGPK